MTPQITEVKVMPEYKLCVRFGNGESRLFDVAPYLSKGVFKKLRNESYLKKVRIMSGGIEWPHEQEMEEGQGIEILNARGLDQTHQDLVVQHTICRTIAECDLAHNHVAAQHWG